jgi:hypothetical protein
MGQVLSSCAYYGEADITFPWAVPRIKRLVAGLPPQGPGSIPGQVMWGVMALGQVFSEYFSFPLPTLIPPAAQYSGRVWCTGSSIGLRTKWTQSHCGLTYSVEFPGKINIRF